MCNPKKIVIAGLIFVLLFSVCYAKTTYRYTLKNGLQLLVRVDNRAPVVISQIWYKVGSSHEALGNTGISHLLEHMMFQGTKKYPTGKLSQIIANHGGIQNAQTSYDYTMYYQELPAKDLAISFKLEADRMHNLNLKQNKFTKELKVVQEEKRLKIDNNPLAFTYTRFAALANIGTPYEHPIIGWDYDLQQMNLVKLRNYYSKYYAPNNAIIVVVGAVKPNTVYKLAKQYFAKIPKAKLPTQTYYTPPKFGRRLLTVKKPAKLPVIFIGYNVPSLTTDKNSHGPYALAVAAAILDLGDSARFSKSLIRNQQFATIADVDYNPFSRLTTVFTIFASPTKNHTIKQLKNAIFKQINLLKKSPASKAELARVKTQLIANKIYAKDSLFGQAYLIGRPEVVGLPWQIGENFVEKIAAITPKQVQKIAKKYFNTDNLTVAVLQPEKL